MQTLTQQQLLDAIEFLQRVFVGSVDEQRLVDTINALRKELKRKQDDQRKRNNRT